MLLKKSIVLLIAIASSCQLGCSLGLKQDYIYDRNMTFSPDDPFVRGDVYKTNIGHDGFNYNCDDEEQKRYQPWIQWRQRPCDSQSCSREIKEYFASYHHAVNRWKMGSCQVCRPEIFTPGAGYGNEGVATASTEAPASEIVTPELSESTMNLEAEKDDYAKDIVPRLIFNKSSSSR